MKKFIVRSLLLFDALLLTTIPAYSQSSHQSGADRPIKLETELVVLDAQVVNKKTGRTVGGLGKPDFTLFEDGAKQEITHFSQGKLPLSIVLLLDVSESVWPGLREIQAGALQALQHLKPEDEVALIVFANNPQLVQNFTTDRSLMADKIRQVDKFKGYGTSIDEAVYQAAATLNKAANPDSCRVIIAITDDESNQPPGKGHSGQEVTNQLFESGSVVCGLIVGPYPYPYKEDIFDKVAKYYPPVFIVDRIADGILRKKLERMRRQRENIRASIAPHSKETGGIVMAAKQKETAAKLTQLIDRLRSRYSIGYVSSNEKRDGTFRKIELKASPAAEKREGRVAIITRKGYYARRAGNTPDAPPGEGSLSAKP